MVIICIILSVLLLFFVFLFFVMFMHLSKFYGDMKKELVNDIIMPTFQYYEDFIINFFDKKFPGKK